MAGSRIAHQLFQELQAILQPRYCETCACRQIPSSTLQQVKHELIWWHTPFRIQNHRKSFNRILWGWVLVCWSSWTPELELWYLELMQLNKQNQTNNLAWMVPRASIPIFVSSQTINSLSVRTARSIAWQALTGAEWSPQNPMPKKPTMTIWAPRNPGSMEGITEYHTESSKLFYVYYVHRKKRDIDLMHTQTDQWHWHLWSTLSCIYWHGIHSPISLQNTIRLLRALGKEKRKCRIAKIYWHDSHVTVQLMQFAAKCLKFLPSCLEMRAFKSFTMQEVRFTSSMESISNGCLSIVASAKYSLERKAVTTVKANITWWLKWKDTEGAKLFLAVLLATPYPDCSCKALFLVSFQWLGSGFPISGTW